MYDRQEPTRAKAGELPSRTIERQRSQQKQSRGNLSEPKTERTHRPDSKAKKIHQKQKRGERSTRIKKHKSPPESKKANQLEKSRESGAVSVAIGFIHKPPGRNDATPVGPHRSSIILHYVPFIAVFFSGDIPTVVGIVLGDGGAARWISCSGQKRPAAAPDHAQRGRELEPRRGASSATKLGNFLSRGHIDGVACLMRFCSHQLPEV